MMRRQVEGRPGLAPGPAFMPTVCSHVLGIDASLTNTAIVSVSLADFRRKSLSESVRVCKIETTPALDLADRLDQIEVLASSFLSSVRGSPGFGPAAVAIEGFSFGDRYRQYDLGAVQGVLRVAVRRRLGLHVTSVTPQASKAFACPAWPGFSKDNWSAAGRSGPFKRSMPNKHDVAQALFARYRYNPGDEHVVDAVLVALAYARTLGVLPDAKAPPVPVARPVRPSRPLRSTSARFREALRIAEEDRRSRQRR